MSRSNSKPERLTNLQTLPLQFRQQFSSPGELLGWMVDVRLRSFRPELSPRVAVASAVGISESELSLMISGQRPIKLHQFCSIALVCNAPEAFLHLRDIYFGNVSAIPFRGSVKS